MRLPPSSAMAALLTPLLEAYERSSAFGKEGPWRRDMILRFDVHAFPTAFAADGREELDALRQAALELERRGALRVVRHDGHAAGEIREIRLGCAELGSAYAAASAAAFVPLREALAELEEAVREQASQDLPAWMRSFLLRLESGLRQADTSLLGMRRERLKRERADVIAGLRAACALAREVAGYERVVSERIFGNSKRLGQVRAVVAELLVRADPRWDGVRPEDDGALLEAYGVRRRPGLLRCAGAARLRVAGREYHLADFTPTANLPEAWGAAWIEGLVEAEVACVTTIENEYPFFVYVEECGGPGALGERGEVVVYTAGFPAGALTSALSELARRRPGARFRHWGDADVGGLRIWWLLRTRLARGIELFRTSAAWLHRVGGERATPIDQAERAALIRLRTQLQQSAHARDEDMRGAMALIEALLQLGIKVEQERY